MQPGNSLSGVTITQSDLVYFSPTPVGIDMTGQGNVTEIWHPVHFGGNYATEEAWTYSRVLAYQENGLPGEIQLAPFYYDPVSGYGNPSTASQDGVIDIVFPGYEITDYSISLSYSGALISAEEESFALGKVTLGADVAEAKVAVVEGDNADNALNQVLGGAVETVSVKESGDVRVPCNYSGTCTMIAVAYDDKGTLQNYATTTFAVIMNAMPGFLVAVILMLVFALKLGWFPPSGADGSVHRLCVRSYVPRRPERQPGSGSHI